ncbi:ribonucleoside hydrolase RihC [Rubripirellula tenax]|uniref:Ribonucleoside hydrolase RihC n=1 Tax=Rubripirellula tenax TaxID=2528015 RepID=A0A5C6F3M7_9BACT|nr:nucleoside hydrolase [Rubripirellula tenax]TWU56403.1 ribonucleoside hydrolase RihC [Rubripirellula tenax]
MIMKSKRGRPCYSILCCYAVALLVGTTTAKASHTPGQRLILDCDTANEIDDLYAIVRMMKQDAFDVVGLTSSQWFHYLGDPKSVEASQKDNEDLMRVLGRSDVPMPQGSPEPLGKPWGGDDAKDSVAAQFIIAQARATPADEHLIVVCTGASTNLASAIKIAPEIAAKIKAYILGFQYDASTGVWNKSEFNIRRDLNAADFLLNQRDLELHIMPTSVSKQLTFDRDDTFTRQQSMGELGRYLTQKWKTKFPNSTTWTMWDLALVESLLHPEMASEKQVNTPPENNQRKVWMYDSIDAAAMKQDYWQTATTK